MAREPELTRERFAERVRGLGFAPSETALDEVWRMLPAVEAMRARLRRRFTHADEPAHVFAPSPRR